MGSLMAGWDSPVLDQKSQTYERNRSFTKGEIEAYWRSKKKTEEEHLRAICGSSPDKSQEMITSQEAETRFLKRSSSLPLTNRKENSMGIATQETSLEKIIKKNGWWTRSNSAFLNEPPVLIAPEGPSTTYAPQFHVANII